VATATVTVALAAASTLVVLMGSSTTRVVAPTIAGASIGVAASPTAVPVAVVERPAPVATQTTIAQVRGPVAYSAEPDGPPVGTLPTGSWWSTTKFLPVIAEAPGWLEVRLPQRPNGLTGWIPADQAQLSATTYGIVINVVTHRLQVYDGGWLTLDFPAGVGTPDDPTPLGDFYVMEFGASRGPGWGPFLLATNAHSEAISSWEGSGDAFTAIHGPLGADAAIGDTGGEISHGCVRLHSADLAQLQPIPPGTPIVITAEPPSPW